MHFLNHNNFYAENQLSEDFVRSFVVDGSKKSNTTTDSFAQSEQSSKPSNQNHYVPKIDCSVQTSEDFFDEQNEEVMLCVFLFALFQTFI